MSFFENLKTTICDRVAAYRKWRLVRCECCCRFWQWLFLEDSRTYYRHDKKPGSINDPNRDQLLCRQCAEMHHAHWDDMWSNVEGWRG